MADRTSLFQALCRSWTVVPATVVVVGAVIGACGESPTTPSRLNTPPTIQSLVVSAPQVEADQSVSLTATVTDTETAPGQLNYAWSAAPVGGTFIGIGSQVTWKAPVGAETPANYTITLTVTESYFSENILKENRVSSTAQVRYNDSMKEITGLVSRFLFDFGTFSVSPQLCVQNFSDTLCSQGKAQELSDIMNNRSRSGVQIESAGFAPPSVTLNLARTSAEVFARCTLTDRYTNGTHGTVTGTCHFTMVYDNSRWFLCTSTFDPPFTTTTYSLDPPYSVTTHGFAPRFSHP